MSDQRITAEQITWRAPFIQLTAINRPNGPIDSSAVFVDPSAISCIRRVIIWDIDERIPENLRMGQTECTEVHCCHYVARVQEVPEMVALLRDKAFGYNPAGPKVA